MESYATVLQADEYITKFYPSQSSLRSSWFALTEEDKNIFLRRATQQIDQLYFIGVKVDETQPNEFPRQVYSTVVALPADIVYGTVEQALSLTDTSFSTEAEYRLQLQRQGVVSFSLGKLSESYGKSPGSISQDLKLSLRAYDFVSKWLERGFEIV